MGEETTELAEVINQLSETNGYLNTMTNEQLINLEKAIDYLVHLAGQADLINHSIYVANNYLIYVTISIMLLSSLFMFLIGYIVARSK